MVRRGWEIAKDLEVKLGCAPGHAWGGGYGG